MDKSQPPTNIKEMGIHQFYIGKEMHRLASLLEEYNRSFVPRSELDLKFQDVHKAIQKNDIDIYENKMAIAKKNETNWKDTLKNTLLIITTFTAIYAVAQLLQGL